MKRIIIILYMLCLLPLLLFAKGGKDTRLVIITIDGLRWQEVFLGADGNLLSDEVQTGDTALARQTYWRPTPEERREVLMPFTWNTLAPKGLIIGNRAKNSKMQVANKACISYPGYCEMMTGMVDDAIVGNAPVNNPHRNVLEAANEDPRYKGGVVMYGSWKSTRFAIRNELAGIPASVSYEPNVAKKQTPCLQLVDKMLAGMPRFWGAEHFDAFTYAYAIETLKNDHPKVMWVSCGDCDEWAHARRYDLYLDGAKGTDAFIRDIYETCEADRFYRGKTTYLITCDHGRGWGNMWAHHDGTTNGSEATWLMLLGKGVEALGEITECGPYYNKQIAATIASILGIDFTPDDGSSLSAIVAF